MDIELRLHQARNLTPAEQQMAQTVLTMGNRLQELSIKEFARAAAVSIASVHRFCKKLDLEGYKELKVELARSLAARADDAAAVDINFPFGPGDQAATIVPRMRSLYTATLRDTCEMLDEESLAYAARLLGGARQIVIFTQSHNLHPAQMFRDRLVSIGRDAQCRGDSEWQLRRALALGPQDVAVMISYSGLAPGIDDRLEVLSARHVPTVYIGTPDARRRHPGLDAYLLVADHEHLQNRITQFASHIAVQFVLDALFSCMFADSYDASTAFLKASLPYMSLLGRNPS